MTAQGDVLGAFEIGVYQEYVSSSTGETKALSEQPFIAP
jgi:hypothetical protein